MVHLESHLSDKTHIIWDWNGTLLNDVEVCVDVMQDLLTKHELPELTVERYREVFQFPVREYYVKLGFDFEKAHSFENLSEEFVSGYAARLDNCSLHHGVKELLHSLKNAGKKQAILSAARETDLLELLDHFEIREFFDRVCGLTNIYAAGKVERGKELLSNWHVDKSRAVLVGDTEHDLEVAHALEIDVILLGGGHQSDHKLQSKFPGKFVERHKARSERK